MPWEPIHKFSQNWDLPPNLLDYDQTYAAFSWETVRRDLDGLPGGRGLNMAHEAVDRHANGARRDHLALRWLGKDCNVRDLTYGDLQEQSNRFANVLASLGVAKGERVHPGRAYSRPLHRSAWHAEARQCLLPPVCRLWPRADLSTLEPGRCHRPGDDGAAV